MEDRDLSANTPQLLTKWLWKNKTHIRNGCWLMTVHLIKILISWYQWYSNNVHLPPSSSINDLLPKTGTTLPNTVLCKIWRKLVLVQPKNKLSWALLHSIWQEEWAVDWSYWCGKLPIYLHFETPMTVAHRKRMEIALHFVCITKCCYLEAAVTKKNIQYCFKYYKNFLKIGLILII